MPKSSRDQSPGSARAATRRKGDDHVVVGKEACRELASAVVLKAG